MQQKLDHLTGLRGLAAVAVMMAHMQMLWSVFVSSTGVFNENTISWKIYNTIFNGNFSVCIFFILSGYVVLIGFYKRKEPKYLISSAIKRYFRLTPVPLFSVLAAWLIYLTFGFHNYDAGKLLGDIPWFYQPYDFTLTISGAIYQGLIGVYHGEHSYNGVLWTIQVELWVSVTLFLITYLSWNSKYFYYINIISGFIAIYFIGNYGLYLTLFLVGGAMCRKPDFHASPWLAILGIFLGVQNDGWSMTTFLQEYLPEKITASVLCHVVGAIILFASINSSESIKKMLSSKALVFIGDVSFSLYAIHIIVLFSLGSWVFVLMHPLVGASPAALSAIAMTVLFSFIASIIMTKFIDSKSQYLSDKIGSLV